LPYGCVCHGLNNFGKDVVSNFGLLSRTLSQVKVVASVFRNVKFCRFHLRGAQIEAYGNTRQLKMPVDTRWNSNIATLASVSNSKRALVNVKKKKKKKKMAGHQLGH
jgi:CelD/BcsL family acetyltransferase involved in cellulose biosynthesis